MPRFLAEEVVARVRELYEGTALTHAKIAAAAGVGESTVSVLAQKNGWRRCHEARTSRRLSTSQCEAIVRLRRAGAPTGDIAAAMECHRDTVRRIAPPEPRAAASGTGAARETGAARSGAAAEAGPVPAHLADLHAVLMSPALRKAEAAAVLVRCAAALGAEALVRPDAQVERTAQALARLAERVAALPDDAGAGDADESRVSRGTELAWRLTALCGEEEEAEKARAAVEELDRSRRGPPAVRMGFSAGR